MYRTLLFLIIISLFAACDQENGNTEGNPELDSLKSENERLVLLSDEKDASVNDMVRSLNEIEQNLATIKEKEGIISVSYSDDSELGEDQKSRIIEDIQLINTLLLENKQKISWLKQQLKKSNMKIGELEKLIDRLTKTIEEKEIEIGELRAQLADLKISMKLLTMENVEQSELIDMQTDQLNTAFYAYGSSKELLEKEIIVKEGGILGLGRTKKLKENFNKGYFTQVDITETKSIDIYAKKAKIITTHPSGSYKLDGQDKVDKLIITDHEKFWSVSKYLVIVVD